MPIVSIAVLSLLAGVIFIINANHAARRHSMSDAERRVEDDELKRLADEGW